MVQMQMQMLKDLGLQREVMDALPYSVVGGAFEGSLQSGIGLSSYLELLNYVVPTGRQLKILFIRVATTDAGGALFSIVQTNPTAVGQTGTPDAYPVVGSVPSGVRDYPLLEAAGAEVIRGSLKDPVQVLEGSIDFRLLGLKNASASWYDLTWWGVTDIPEAH